MCLAEATTVEPLKGTGAYASYERHRSRMLLMCPNRYSDQKDSMNAIAPYLDVVNTADIILFVLNANVNNSEDDMIDEVRDDE